MNATPNYPSPEVLQGAIRSCFFGIDLRESGSSPVDQARLENVRLGQIDVSSYHRVGPQYGHRRWDHIRQDHVDGFLVYMPLSKPCLIEQDGRENELRPGCFTFIATNRPFQIVQHAGQQELYSTVQVMMPGTLIRRHLHCIDDLSNKSFPIEAGVSRITAQMIEALLRDGAMLSAEGAAEMGAALVNMVTGTAQWAAGLCGARPTASEAAAKRIVMQAKTFIESQLSDPALDTAMVAQKCHISARYLQAAFKSSGETVAAYIRERRLSLCRQALRDGKLTARTITEIAGQWGFDDLSQFGRAYKTRFGITPRQERAQ